MMILIRETVLQYAAEQTGRRVSYPYITATSFLFIPRMAFELMSDYLGLKAGIVLAAVG